MKPAPTVEVENAHVVYEVFEDRSQGLKKLFASGKIRREARRIHAVRGVSFSVFEGETLGIIGSNGSGKSTLLAAMTGLLPLQSGNIRVRTRPALLGVSAALRASLSGRRNVLIGCLALGLSPAEIDERIDDIIDFSGIREFIDLPMRTYSSGMRARLNFAIASAATASILLIDEALAVGDEEFQRRSQGRIDEIREAAGSVVLVSHNLSEIERACDRVIWLERGEVRAEGNPAAVIAEYLKVDSSASPKVSRPPVAASRVPAMGKHKEETVTGRRAVIHIGVASAGDALLQADLFGRRSELVEAGYTYPSFLGAHDHHLLAAYGSQIIGKQLGLGELDQWQSWREQFRSSFLDAMSSGGNLVATSVALARITDVEGCNEVAGLLAEAGFETLEVVMYVRRQDECASLSHLRKVNHGRTAPFDIDEHLNAVNVYDFEAIASRWDEASGVSGLHVRLHRDRPSMKSNGFRFAALAGISLPPEREYEPEAEYGPREVGLLRAFNERVSARTDVNRYGWLMARRSARAESGLRLEEATALLSAFAESNENVLARIPEGERIEGYFDKPLVEASAELPYGEDDLWGLAEELAAHASLLNRQLKRLARDT